MPATITQKDLQAALPDVTSDMKLDGLKRAVTIYRDRWGIPHIRADNEHDAFFAQGFATAQDRLWHMDYDRHRALGRWAEWAGPRALREDRLMRRLSLERAAKADLNITRPDAKAMVEAYTSGVNAFIDATKTLPVEYTLLEEEPEPWEPWHCYAVYKLRNILMGTFDMKIWRARLANALGPERAATLFKGYPVGSLVTTPPGVRDYSEKFEPYEELAEAWQSLNWLGELDAGSNAWVVGGNWTASGKPLVAGDSHRALDTPSVYYQTHITCPAFSVSGYAVPGVPGAPHFSHTEHVAYGMTHGNADYQDAFIERFRTGPDGKLEFEYRGGWYPADVRTEEIRARGHESIHAEVVTTRHGPVVAGDPRKGTGLTFHATGTNTGTRWMDSVLDILRARSADELESAVKEWTEPVNNYMYADTVGQYGYRLRGRIPIRHARNTWTPAPGWDGEHEWEREVPWDEMPRVRNPEVGYAVTCNQRVTTEEYPYHINHYFANGWRAERIISRINDVQKGHMTVEEMGRIHADRQSIPAQWVAQRIAGLRLDDQRMREAQSLLAVWDGEMDRDGTPPTIVAEVIGNVEWEVFRYLFGPMADEVLTGSGRGAPSHGQEVASHMHIAIRDDDESMLPEGRTWDGVLTDALAAAVNELTERLGQDMSGWQWGRLHRTKPSHPLSAAFPETGGLLDPPEVPMGGGFDTPQAGTASLADKWTITGLSVNRYIHDPSNWNNSRWISPLGASGHPGSRHFADQAPIWGEVETIPQLWDWDEIASSAETKQELRPR
ncbi:MAG: penicillin acylase family protein [Chloroflexota bacterium]